jgi:hypothetical protein
MLVAEDLLEFPSSEAEFRSRFADEESYVSSPYSVARTMGTTPARSERRIAIAIPTRGTR